MGDMKRCPDIYSYWPKRRQIQLVHVGRSRTGSERVWNQFWCNVVEIRSGITAVAAQTNVEEDFIVPFSLAGVPETEHFVGRKEELIKIKTCFKVMDLNVQSYFYMD